jgi:hypothetical protein
VLPSETLPKLTVEGLAVSAAVPEPPSEPEPPLEPDPDELLVPLLTTPAQLERPIENTIRASVASSVTTSRETVCFVLAGPDEDNSSWGRSRQFLIIQLVYGPPWTLSTGRGNKQRTGKGEGKVQAETALTCTSSRRCFGTESSAVRFAYCGAPCGPTTSDAVIQEGT